MVILFSIGLLVQLGLGSPIIKAPGDLPAYIIAGPEEIARSIQQAPRVPSRPLPRRDPIIGETFEVGNTYADYWTNGVCGKLIAVDELGGVHITWMDGYDADLARRQQKYNFREENEWLEEDGMQVPPGTRSGFGSIALSWEEEPRALVFCHAEGIQQEIISVACIDFGRGWGAFEAYALPRYPEYSVIWPQGVISPNGVIHVVYNRRDAGMISYTRAPFNEGEPNFPDVPIVVSRTSLNTYRIARSPRSERVAICWTKSRVGIPAPPEWEGFLAYQMNNDLWLAWSDNGRDWNFDNPLNVTQVIPPDPDREGAEAYGDTFRPFVNFDLIFDDNDYIHIVFEARGMWEMPEYDPEVNRPPVDGMTIDASFLFHWSEEDCTITPVASGWFSQAVFDENDSLVAWPIPGAWKSNVCAPSLGYDEEGNLYCVFNYYPREDYNDYVGNRGRCHGDIMVTVSEDNGRTWYYPTPIVQTRTHLAQSGEALSETYPSLHEVVDDYLHIVYLIDREAGTVIQNDANASNTLNPVIYQRVPREAVRRDSIWEGPRFHYTEEPVYVSRETPRIPIDAFLLKTYPNPFNRAVFIEWTMNRAEEVRLTLYDLEGKAVREVWKGKGEAGHHRVSLNADDLPSGVYLLRLEGSYAHTTQKIALMR